MKMVALASLAPSEVLCARLFRRRFTLDDLVAFVYAEGPYSHYSPVRRLARRSAPSVAALRLPRAWL